MKPNWERQIEAWVKEVENQWKDPDFWKLTLLFLVIFLMAALFFFLAVRYDLFARMGGQFGVACRKLDDWKATVMFVSPFAIGLSMMVATGELLSQMERARRARRQIAWGSVFKSFGVAVSLFAITGTLMIVWC